jgi:poly(hydroxyalkanoate) depolymerase family esterase
MARLARTLSRLSEARGHWAHLLDGADRAAAPSVSTKLREVRDFGENPGNLRMLAYVPERLAAAPALVVVLHGCTQTAAGYDHGSGWSTLAERHGFALLFPEQQRANNPNGCFTWFERRDTERDVGEALSIRRMVDRMIADHGIDRSRIFVTGLSAGGAMASVMLATYPEVFAGGAIIAGLPYGAATNVQEAFDAMFKGDVRPARQWGDLVRRASPHKGPWPKVSVWHGTADRTVIATNGTEIVKQWTDVHGLAAAPAEESRGAGFSRRVWRDAAGRALVESVTIPGMAHGTPLAAGDGEGRCGVAGPFLLDVGVSSTHHIASFWGLTGEAAERAPRIAREEPARPAASPNFIMLRNDAAQDREAAQDSEVDDDARPKRLPIDVQAVITKALKAAGLMRS